ncbi:MAG: hypothetical protein FWF36_00220 [Propionibacteriaceae bacterium]|nr:hypothetical protein [Propionibacteriaceae bacterium]
MTIKTSQALSGFIADKPVQTPEGDHIRADVTVGQSRVGRTSDGDVVALKPDLCHMIVRRSAVAALSRLRVGDQFVAAGRMGVEDVLNADTGQVEERPVFTADRVGPDAASLSFDLMLHRLHPRSGILEPVGPTRPVGPTQPVGFTSAHGGKPDAPTL